MENLTGDLFERVMKPIGVRLRARKVNGYDEHEISMRSSGYEMITNCGRPLNHLSPHHHLMCATPIKPISRLRSKPNTREAVWLNIRMVSYNDVGKEGLMMFEFMPGSVNGYNVHHDLFLPISHTMCRYPGVPVLIDELSSMSEAYLGMFPLNVKYLVGPYLDSYDDLKHNSRVVQRDEDVELMVLAWTSSKEFIYQELNGLIEDVMDVSMSCDVQLAIVDDDFVKFNNEFMDEEDGHVQCRIECVNMYEGSRLAHEGEGLYVGVNRLRTLTLCRSFNPVMFMCYLQDRSHLKMLDYNEVQKLRETSYKDIYNVCDFMVAYQFFRDPGSVWADYLRLSEIWFKLNYFFALRSLTCEDHIQEFDRLLNSKWHELGDCDKCTLFEYITTVIITGGRFGPARVIDYPILVDFIKYSLLTRYFVSHEFRYLTGISDGMIE